MRFPAATTVKQLAALRLMKPTPAHAEAITKRMLAALRDDRLEEAKDLVVRRLAAARTVPTAEDVLDQFRRIDGLLDKALAMRLGRKSA
jgi:predicted ThiF/HesA family dinucleotide-utilizing enzyme